MEELISVIVPVYNVEKYLSRCVDSLINQTYTNLEILLIDDGSTDHSGDMCETYKNVDKRIFVYHKKNGGLSSARNYGIDRSNGSLLAFIDSDDLVDARFFEVLIEERKRSGADILSTDLLFFFKDSELKNVVDCKLDVFHIEGPNILKTYFEPTNKNAIIYHGLCMKIYDRNLFSNLRFEEGRLHEDLYITYQLLNKAKLFSFIPAKYYFYFQSNTSSISKNYGKKNFFDIVDAFDAMLTNLSNREDISSALTHFLVLRYLDLISKGVMLKDSEVKSKIKDLKHWVRANLKNDNYLNSFKKAVVRLMLINIKLYDFVIRLRGLNE